MLVVDISINRKKRIEEIGIVRIMEETEGCEIHCTPHEDEVFTYKYGFIVDGKIPEYLGELKHRYGDCGLQLAAAVLSEIAKNDTIELSKLRDRDREHREMIEFFKLTEEVLNDKKFD